MKLKTLFAAAILATASLGSAQAGLLTVENASVTVWNYMKAGQGSEDNATPTAPLPGSLVYTGSYSGAINFRDGGYNSIGSFLGSAGGTFVDITNTFGSLNSKQLSSGGFDLTTMVNIVFTLTTGFSGIVEHDDGISIWDAANTIDLFDSSAPTAEIDTVFTLEPGTYSLWYSAANGLPEALVVSGTAVPEPASLALLGLGLLGLGAFRRRHQA